MRRLKFEWMLIIVCAMIVVAACISAPRPAYACSCVTPKPSRDVAFSEAAAVFTGQVLTVDRAPMGDELYTVRARLVVSAPEKGVSDRFVEVWTPEKPDACGYSFQVGQLYRVFADRSKDSSFLVDSCSATMLIDAADAVRPLPDPAVSILTMSPTRLFLVASWLAIVVLVVPVALWMLIRRRTGRL
jgi:hypothetical protein